MIFRKQFIGLRSSESLASLRLNARVTLLLLVLAATATLGASCFVLRDQSSKDEASQPSTLDVCALVREPKNYESKTVRIRSVLLGYHELALYSPSCDSQIKYVRADVDSKSRNQLVKGVANLGGRGMKDGNFWVEVSVIGRFEKIPESDCEKVSKGSETPGRYYVNYCYRIVVSDVEQVNEVPQGISWPEHQHPIELSGISGEDAVAKVKDHVSKTDRSILKFDIVDCEQVLFWRVIFDGSNREYLVDKKTARIVNTESIPHGSLNPPNEGTIHRSEKQGISRDEAIVIAKRSLQAHARETDPEWFIVDACELSKVWRIIFDIRLTLQPGQSEPIIPHAGTWQYSIDKKSGQILHKALS